MCPFVPQDEGGGLSEQVPESIEAAERTDRRVYTMNRAGLVFAIRRLIGLTPMPKVEADAA
jgi:hypothetical protein